MSTTSPVVGTRSRPSNQAAQAAQGECLGCVSKRQNLQQGKAADRVVRYNTKTKSVVLVNGQKVKETYTAKEKVTNPVVSYKPYVSAPLTISEIDLASEIVYALPGFTFDPTHDMFDPFLLKEPPKYKVLSKTDVPRIIEVPFWKGGSTDIYTVYTIQLTYTPLAPVEECQTPFEISGQLISTNVIECARPKWSCLDQAQVTKTILEDTNLVDKVIKRINDSKTSGVPLITRANFDRYVIIDVEIDGRLDDCCKKYNCQGVAKILKSNPRPRAIYVGFYYNDALLYCNNEYFNSSSTNTNTCAICECVLECEDCGGDYLGTTAYYTQPIEGIFVLYDRRQNIILDIYEDPEIYPIPNNGLNLQRIPRGLKDDYTVDGTPLLTDLQVVYPNNDGPSFTFYYPNDNLVTWQNFQFRVGLDANSGPVLYEIKYLDRTRQTGIGGPSVPYKPNDQYRSICYRLNMSELITAYGSNSQFGRMRNFFDVGEFAPNAYMVPIEIGTDTPKAVDTVYPADFSLPDGSSFSLPNAFAIYEMPEIGALWRHTDYSCTECVRTQGRADRVLVFQYLYVVGNYDYTVLFMFTLDGRIQCRVQASGAMEAEGSKLFRVKQPEDIPTGSLIGPGVNAMNHAHVIGWRIDLDIDGTNNSVVENNVEKYAINCENPCGNAWTEVETPLKTVHEAIRDHDFNKGRSWTVENERSSTDTGYHRGYTLIPSPSPKGLFNPCLRVTKRAQYMEHNLYVTPYSDDEIYTVGKYPVEMPHDTGLGEYIKKDANIENKDIVLWYTTGIVHKPAKEQWPMMTREIIGFDLIPENFFQENPALDVQTFNLPPDDYCS